MQSVIALTEEFHFGRAARRLCISQLMLTTNIQDVEALIGPSVSPDRKHVVLSDAGRAYVQQARISLLYGERAVQSARAATQGVDETFLLTCGDQSSADLRIKSNLVVDRLALLRKPLLAQDPDPALELPWCIKQVACHILDS